MLASETVVSRTVKFPNSGKVQFPHSVQDGPGDGTVPQQSGMGSARGVKQLFHTRGYDHQGSYANESMLALTMQLIVRIAQEAK